MAITQDYSGPKDIAYQKVKEYIGAGKLPKELSADSIQWDDKSCHATLKGKGFEAVITTKEQNKGSQVCFELKLSLFLKPFQKMVEPQIQHHLKKALS